MVQVVMLFSALTLIGTLSASSERELPSVLYTIAEKYVPQAWLSGGDRFPAGSQIYIQNGRDRHLLVKDFASTTDASVSFDGSHVLFAGKKNASDPWQIYEVATNGDELRRVASCKEDCVRPFYLPEDRVVYAHKVQGAFAIEVAPIGGGAALPLTYVPGNYLPSDVLRDGRILFESASPLGGTATTDLYAVYSDGSGIESYRCDHAAARHGGRQLQSGDIVFATGKGLARFTSALAQGVPIPSPKGEFADIAEMPSGEWLVSWRSDSRKNFELRRWQPGSNQVTEFAAGRSHVVQPMVVEARVVPNRHPSGLHDWNYANLLCLNSYTSKENIAKGSVASVRVHTQDASGHDKVLGTAAVEPDGSFYLRTPADQPLKIELLDRSGNTVKKEEGWFWLRRGEQRVCVGCHAGPETAPENAVPAVLLRSTTPTDLTGQLTASHKEEH